MSQLPQTDFFLQSPYLYAQAVGSDETDFTAPGIHLRWGFLKNLGLNHLPKGGLAQQSAFNTGAGFNRADDYVYIYRAFYSKRYVQISFDVLPREVVINTPVQKRQWFYDSCPVNNSSLFTTVVLNFLDTVQYDQLKIQYGLTNELIKAYTGTLEVFTKDPSGFEKLFFAAEMDFKVKDEKSLISNSPPMGGSPPSGSPPEQTSPPTGDYGDFKIEMIKLSDSQAPNDNSKKSICLRKEYIGDDIHINHNDGLRWVCENVQSMRFSYNNYYPTGLRIETYYDFFFATNDNGSWDFMGQYSLALDDATVIDQQLNNSPYSNIDKRWPKYFEPDVPNTDDARISTDNYRDRWNQNPDGLRKAVDQYLLLSRFPNNLQALDIVPFVSQNNNFEISYLKMLNLVALDYHVARMLGLGAIDNGVGSDGAFIHIAHYVTDADLQNATPNINTSPLNHFFMTLPTAMTDYRYPPTPELDAPTYGLYVDDGTGTMINLCDAGGYSDVDHSRYININKSPVILEQPYGPFFYDSRELCCCKTKPVMYGVEYKVAGAAAWQPETISNDEDYTDAGNTLHEVVPLPEQSNPIFTHEEKNNGVHTYGLYAINWFSRISDIDSVYTDYTDIEEKSTLVPPLNMAVQLIQSESPRVLTSGTEQVMLNDLIANNSIPDKTLVRLTFDWNNIHNNAYHWQDGGGAYHFADKIEFFFKKDLPLSARGKITSVVEIANHLVEVHTSYYELNSAAPAPPYPHVTPTITDVNRYIGGYMSVNQLQFEISDIDNTNNDAPIFKLKMIRQTSASSPGNNGQYFPVTNYLKPNVNDLFMVTENLNKEVNWDYKLNKTVSLYNFNTYNGQALYTETISEPIPPDTIVIVGGIFRSAQVSERFDALGARTGVYEIVYSSFSIPDHNAGDVNVKFEKGFVRAQAYNSPLYKTLQVLRVESYSPSLTLLVFDPDYNDPLSPPFIQLGGVVRTVNVNYHPSYKIYFYAEASSLFTSANILPPAVLSPTASTPGNETRITYIGARSVDTVKSLKSYFTPAIPMVARKINDPITPALPSGSKYASRPDIYGKASLTFTSLINKTPTRVPYAYIFYRANERQILETLYKPSTVASIYLQLSSMTGDDLIFTPDRWLGLINLEREIVTGKVLFKIYGASGTYRFPMPDNPNFKTYDGISTITPFVNPLPTSLTDVSGTLQILECVKRAIQQCFIPLTEQPVIYQYIKIAENTRATKPKIRNKDGEILMPTDPDFDPYPMVVRSSNDSLVRFTDFTLDGSSNSIYFYRMVEMSSQLKVSLPSQAFGPVKLVNTFPAETPQIRRVLTQLEDTINGIPASIKFEINQYLPTDNIKKIRIFRAYNDADAKSVLSMQPGVLIDIDPADPINEVTDTFSDLNYIPYGEPLFYRLVAYRQFKNEFDDPDPEFAPSQPSKLVLSNLVDVKNPQAPVLTIQHDPIVGLLIDHIIISWSPTAYNSTYRLFKMNSTGNWVKITEIKSNDTVITFNWVDPVTGLTTLPKLEADGVTPIFHRFKVGVENSSGLLNLTDNEFTI